MASLTPLSKGLIGLVVIGGMASAVWHLGLKDQWRGLLSSATAPAVSAPPVQTAPQAAPQATPAAPATPAPANTSVASGTASQQSAAANAESGRKLLTRGDFAQARVYLEAAVQGGDAAAACHLGEMTLKGQGGIAASQEQAAKLFQLAQSRGSICFAPAQ